MVGLLQHTYLKSSQILPHHIQHTKISQVQCLGLLLGPGSPASKAPGAYMTSSDCWFLSSRPFLFHLAALLSFLPSSLALYLLFCILLMSLSIKKCSQRGVISSPRWDTEASEIDPSLKQHTANAQAVSTPSFPRRRGLGQNFHTSEWRDSFAFCV